ncbi:hypothetical protein M8818_004198 [Zalaria obscura]|uniref:Uncharacterized protein n=1 Tax=Zalaria obscura TaxID=2024903 RepID=A0ACC3SD02_9PEZI
MSIFDPLDFKPLPFVSLEHVFEGTPDTASQWDSVRLTERQRSKESSDDPYSPGMAEEMRHANTCLFQQTTKGGF